MQPPLLGFFVYISLPLEHSKKLEKKLGVQFNKFKVKEKVGGNQISSVTSYFFFIYFYNIKFLYFALFYFCKFRESLSTQI